MKLDSAVISLLNLDPATTSVTSAGGGGMSSARTLKITTSSPPSSDRPKTYFMKTGTGREAEVMFAGEHASLNAIHSVVPTLCPRSFGHGAFADSPGTSFLVTDFLELTGRGGGGGRGGGTMTLAQKLGKLHSTPAHAPEGEDGPRFGFPVPTCCGDTPQDNAWNRSWAGFYADSRLRFIRDRAERTQGSDGELRKLVERTCEEVVPRLIGDGHLNGGRGVVPVVVHGDLWSGNASGGRLPGMEAAEELVFDSSACYAHSEYELGIMRMFGGFGGGFLKEYHQIVPKTEPVEEYDDRVRLYELYHHLNHHALFGGGYRSGAVGIMKALIAKYGNDRGAKGEL